MTTPPTLAPPTARPGPLPLGQRLWALWQRHRGWLWTDVVAVFLLTRLALLGVAWFAGFFPNNLGYPDPGAAERGWGFTPVRVVDIWARWDSGWYYDLITNGYYANGAISTAQSNLAFFPLYPYTVKALLVLAPPVMRSPGGIVLMGLLVSNAFLLGGLALLRQWVFALVGDPAVARRTVLYLLLFPTGFVFSAVYTESAFLFFSVAALLAAQRRAWGWASLAGAALTLSRPLGLLILVPLAWEYAQAAGWQVRRVRWDAAWFALLPLSLLVFFYWQYTLTGDPLTALHAQAAWQHAFNWPWATLLHPQEVMPYTTLLEQSVTVLFLALVGLAFWRLPSRGLALYALLMIAPPLFTGQLASTLRYSLALTPAFVVLAQLGRRPLVDRAITLAAPMAQALLFALWCQFFWVA